MVTIARLARSVAIKMPLPIRTLRQVRVLKRSISESNILS
jgi:hypothetical protein